MRSPRWAIAAVVAAALVVAGCGGDSDTGDSPTVSDAGAGNTASADGPDAAGSATSGSPAASSAAAPTAGAGRTDGRLIIGTGSAIRTLNPAVQSGFQTAFVGAQLFAGLVRYENDFEPMPYLAESWEWSEDNLQLTLNLLQGATFHDGELITAQDVAFSIDAVKNNHAFGTAMFGPVTDVQTPDEATVVITLEHPHPALMASLSPAMLPILPEHVYGDGQDLKTHPKNTDGLVGSGPYRLTEYDATDRIVMERYDGFFDDNAPALAQLYIKFFPDADSVVTAMMAGEIDLGTSFDPTIANRVGGSAIVLADSGYEAAGALNWLGVNTKSEKLTDVRVRQAIAHAVDLDFIIDQLHAGMPKAAPGPIHPDGKYFSDQVNTYPLDLEKAGALLDEAGYPAQSDGTRMSLRIDYMPGSDIMAKNVAEALASQLSKVGITLELRTSPDFATWSERVSNFDYDLTMDSVYNWADPVIGVNRTYLCDNIQQGVVWANMSQYCNPKVDELLIQAAQEMDETVRADLYAQAQKIITEELPIIFLESQALTNFYRENVIDPPNGIWGVMSPILATSVAG